MTSQDIARFLLRKHAEDLAVEQCRTGESGRNLHIFDLWVMARSWAHPRTIGYEIKVSRQDFLSDRKWMGYLPFCNELWFACPRDLIGKDEVPAECGLIWFSDKGAQITRKKAPYRRDGVDVSQVYKYILMSRTQVTAPRFAQSDYEPRQVAAFWQQWLEDKDLKKAVGQIGSRSIRQRFAKEVLEVRAKQQRLEESLARYADMQQLLIKLGMSPLEPPSTWVFEKRVRAAVGGIPAEHIERLRALGKVLEVKADEIERLNNEFENRSSSGAPAPSAP